MQIDNQPPWKSEEGSRQAGGAVDRYTTPRSRPSETGELDVPYRYRSGYRPPVGAGGVWRDPTSRELLLHSPLRPGRLSARNMSPVNNCCPEIPCSPAAQA